MSIELLDYQIFFSNLIFLNLVFTMFLYWINLILQKNNAIYSVAKFSGLLASLNIFMFLSWRWYNFRYFPLSNLYESLMFLDCLLLFGYKFLEYKTNSKIIGVLIVPLVILIYGFGTLSLPSDLQKASALVPALQSNWLMLHVSMMMLSYATLILGSLFSILYMVLYYNKSKSLNFLAFQKTEKKDVSLLNSLDNWSYRTIGLGFPLLTMGIISGGIWANEAWGSYWSWDPKETWALITWLIFATYLHTRINKGWSGLNTAKLGSIGFFIIWICYLGVNFLGQGLHSYGWLS